MSAVRIPPSWDESLEAFGTASMPVKPDEITEIEPVVPYSVFWAFAVVPDPLHSVAIDCGEAVGVEVVGIFQTLESAKAAVVHHFKERIFEGDVPRGYVRLAWFSDDGAWTAQPEERQDEGEMWHRGVGWYGIRRVRVRP